MRILNFNGVSYLCFDNFIKAGLIKHFFSTRIGGVSSGCYESLNLSFSRGDTDHNVSENRRLVSQATGIYISSALSMKQVHGVKVHVVSSKEEGLVGDGLITNTPDLPLTTYHADCVPIYFYDPLKKVIGLAHAGWRGTVSSIASVMVSRMVEAMGCRPRDILAGIGPSICRDCFEVDFPVYQEFLKTLGFSEKFMRQKNSLNEKNISTPNKSQNERSISEQAKHQDETLSEAQLSEPKFLIDLWAVNKEILIQTGLRPENIETTELCTKCHEDMFYSHRRDGDKRGAMLAAIEL